MNIIRAVLAILLLSFTASNSKNDSIYSLSPPILPQAFVGQYYTCAFRVNGLTDPTYKFMNLPPFLKSSQNGRIQGIPNKKGSFTISLTYSQGKISGQTQLVLSVSNSQKPSTRQNQQLSANPAKSADSISQIAAFYPQIPCVYNTGDKIFLNLSYYLGASRKVWSYLKLPSDLTGTSNGSISGTFNEEGLYSFAALNSDQNGKIQTLIITLNIQPSYYYAFWGGYHLDDVPVRGSCSCYSKAIQTQELAVILVSQAKAVLAKAQQKLNDANDQIAKNAVALTIAQSKLKAQTQIKQLILAKQSILIKTLQSSKDNYNRNKQIYQLAVTNFKNSQLNYENATQKLKLVQKNFNKSKTTLQAANKAFIQAQNASLSAANSISDLQIKIAGYKEDVQGGFSAVSFAKQNLLNYQSAFTNASFDSSNAQSAKDITSMQNDIANSDYKTKQSLANKSLLDLAKANQNVTQLKDELNNAFISLGQAKFNLTQAMNQLLVAQAIKAQTDKSIAIISSQLNQSSNSTNSTFIFEGCQKGGYPSFSGSLVVNQLISNGFKLASGHTLLYGNCTKNVQVNKGDLIKFVGYLKGGVIQALSISK